VCEPARSGAAARSSPHRTGRAVARRRLRAGQHGWLCDKGRYGYDWVHAESRLHSPMVRTGAGLVPSSWPQALDAAAAVLRGTRQTHGADAIAVLGGARGTNEDAYAWARLARR